LRYVYSPFTQGASFTILRAFAGLALVAGLTAQPAFILAKIHVHVIALKREIHFILEFSFVVAHSY
jgi:hypothetical protein